jgi:hypothetical protein
MRHSNQPGNPVYFIFTVCNIKLTKGRIGIPEKQDLDLPGLDLFNALSAIIYHIAAAGNFK